ncbi:MAG: tyrosine/phenylalanine carboxypeptidase domain-containing protein, partial [Acidimicrobiia bacterium]
ELQEAMGVLAEHLTSGLSLSRLRMLASRVLVAHRRARGVPFREVHHELMERGFRRREAFTTVMRAYRAGGNTKDAIYLRGLMRLLEQIRAGVDLSILYVGKISFEAVPLIDDLTSRAILQPPPLRPMFLDDPTAQERLRAIKNGAEIIDSGGRAA